MAEPNAILAINSLDRYSYSSGNSQATFGDALISQYNNTGQPCNNFIIQSPGALIYGYIKKIQVSQTQLEYNVPTIIPDRNDGLWISNGFQPDFVTLPFGFYTPTELAAGLNVILNTTNVGILCGGITVTYSPEDGFTFISAGTGIHPQIAFPTLTEIEELTGDVLNYDAVQNALRTYRLLGIDINNSYLSLTQKSVNVPIFLYTPYVDICSETLTKYQKVKDTNTAPQKLSTIISRIYLSGTGPPQPLSATQYADPIGCFPFVITQDMSYCKTIRWSKDEAVNSLDFKLYDQYGELLFTSTSIGTANKDTYYTEFQMTLMCIEGEKG